MRLPQLHLLPRRNHVKRRSVPEVEDAMSKGEDLLFKKRMTPEPVWMSSSVLPNSIRGTDRLICCKGWRTCSCKSGAKRNGHLKKPKKVEPGKRSGGIFRRRIGAEQTEELRRGAKNLCSDSLEIRPDLAEAHYELARSLWGLGKWQAAEPHVRKAIELNQDYAGPHALMGNIYIQREDPEAALQRISEVPATRSLMEAWHPQSRGNYRPA